MEEEFGGVEVLIYDPFEEQKKMQREKTDSEYAEMFQPPLMQTSRISEFEQ
jgi:hypothetical protein